MKRAITDFPPARLESTDEMEPGPASLDEFSTLRSMVMDIRSVAMQPGTEDCFVEISDDVFLHLFSDNDSFGVFASNPFQLGTLAMKAPLAMAPGRYLRVPQSHKEILGYVAGSANEEVSSRSITRVSEACGEWLLQRVSPMDVQEITA